jgi:hypothetical protein
MSADLAWIGDLAGAIVAVSEEAGWRIMPHGTKHPWQEP